MPPFEPLFRHPHLQTIGAHLWRRRGLEGRFPLERRFYRTGPRVEVLVESQMPAAAPAGHLVMVHGLEGSGQAGYVRSLAGRALAAGFAAHRFHMRTCGGTETRCDTLYHAGLTADLKSVLCAFRAEGRAPVFAAGFSLGGNVVLKLAGELGESGGSLLAGVCAISAPVDLAASSRRLATSENRIYERRFVRRMRSRLLATGRYQPSQFAGLRTLLEFDDRITAPSFGFGTAANYYRTQSAVRYLEDIRIPVLLIQAQDDPLVPFDVFESATVRANPCIRLLAPEHGGHLGFLGRRPHRFWADDAIMEWIGGQTAKNIPVDPSFLSE
jgi:predicted alpha/beta-fold hydrolase